MGIFGFENSLLSLLSLALIVFTLWALVDAITRRPEVFEAASKLTKPAWLLILGLSLAVTLVFGMVSILGFVAVVATIVYHVDVRPALAALTRRR